MRGLTIDFETADRITLCCLKDQLAYLLRDQQWFEADDEGKKKLGELWNYKPYVHPDDYAINRDKHIPALRHLIAYFGGTDD